MVRLTRIYTRTGDDGTTGLADGSRRSKDDLRLCAYGSVDELNAQLGVAVEVLREIPPAEGIVDVLVPIQNDLFDLGADLATPGESEGLRVEESQVRWLEARIDEFNAELPSLESFVLPGGSLAAAHLHVARTVCRRAERETVALSREEEIGEQVLRYLNRLSDLCFVLARTTNRLPGSDGDSDRLWVPGAHR